MLGLLTHTTLLGAANATATACAGSSALLPAAQCQGWVDLYDSTNGGNWTGNGQGCTRHDPCSPACHAGANPVCNPAGTSIMAINLANSNLAGTLPSSMGAWTDVAIFSVWGNALTGSLPATLAAWQNMTGAFEVAGNRLSGGVLPALNLTHLVEDCWLLDHSDGGANAFTCPWPAGVTARCLKYDDTGNFAPITNADCSNRRNNTPASSAI